MATKPTSKFQTQDQLNLKAVRKQAGMVLPNEAAAIDGKVKWVVLASTDKETASGFSVSLGDEKGNWRTHWLSLNMIADSLQIPVGDKVSMQLEGEGFFNVPAGQSKVMLHM